MPKLYAFMHGEKFGENSAINRRIEIPYNSKMTLVDIKLKYIRAMIENKLSEDKVNSTKYSWHKACDWDAYNIELVNEVECIVGAWIINSATLELIDKLLSVSINEDTDITCIARCIDCVASALSTSHVGYEAYDE